MLNVPSTAAAAGEADVSHRKLVIVIILCPGSVWLLVQTKLSGRERPLFYYLY